MIRGIIFDCYGVLYGSSAVRGRDERALTLVKKSHMSHKTALLSNIGRSSVDQIFTQEELETLFDAVVLSNEVGMVKPDPGIYGLTAQQLGLLPEECLMIDDSPANVMGAEAAGMTGLLYTDAQQCEVEMNRLLERHDA